MGKSVTGFLVLGMCFAVVLSAAAEESKEAATFVEAVIAKSISLMPEDVRTKLASAEKGIVAAAKPKAKSTKDDEPFYFVKKAEGPAPECFAEGYRQARKNIAEGKPISSLTAVLGRLAYYTMALSQPYHTEQTAFEGDEHTAFEKKLDSQAGTLKVEAAGYTKVDNPSEFAVRIAGKANDELKKLAAGDEGKDSVPGAVFTLAVNSLTSVWRTLLEKPASESGDADAQATGKFVGNKRSLKFHVESCRYLPAEKNRIYFQTREEATGEGYVPCKVCKP